MCAHMSACAYIKRHMYKCIMCMRTYMYVYIYMWVCVHLHYPYTQPYITSSRHRERVPHVYIYICFYLFIYMHTYIYTFTTAKTEFFPHTEFELKCHSGCRRHRCTGNAIVYECSSTGAHALELCRV